MNLLLGRRMVVAAAAVVAAMAGCQDPPPPTAPRGTAPGVGRSTDGWRDTFAVERANLVPTGGSEYFPLEPGRVSTLRAGDETLTITVLAQTRVVDGVTTRVVEEREEKGGQLKEVSRNLFAADRETGDVYYFGEEVDIYRDGRVVGHEGAWLAGVNGARFGLFMPARPTVGDGFYQEIAPGVAMDRAEIVSVDERLTTPAGTFERCVRLKETTPLDRGVSHKWFAPGVGLIKDDGCVLVQRGTTKQPSP
jgi:hypothetical protein